MQNKQPLTWLRSSLVWLLIVSFTLTSCASNPSFLSSGEKSSNNTKLVIGSAGKQVFDGFRAGNRSYPVYRPNTADGKQTVALLQNIQQKYKRTEDIPENERKAGLQALLKISNYLEEEYARKHGGFIVPPRTRVVKNLRTYCLDEGIPAPKKGEKMHIIKINKVLKGKYLDAYLAIIEHAEKTGKYDTVQGVIWKLRKKAANPSTKIRLNKNEKIFVDGAAPKVAQVLLGQGASIDAGGLLAAIAIGVIGKHLDNDAGKVLAAAVALGTVGKTMSEMERMPVSSPIPNDYSEYTKLAQGVASRIISQGGAKNLTIEVVNNTTQPYAFVPTEVAAQSKRKVQRLGVQSNGSAAESLALDFIPFIGNLKALCEFFAGVDCVTGEEIDRGWALAGIALGGLAKLAGKGAKGGKNTGKGINQAPNDWHILSGNLRKASKGKGNFNIGKGTREQANAMGKAWVGSGYKTAKDGKTLISADGLRQYRPPSVKPNSPHASTGVQANYQSRSLPRGNWTNNGHFDITD